MTQEPDDSEPQPPSPPPAKRGKGLFVLGGVAGALILVFGGVAIGAAVAAPETPVAAQPSATVPTTESTPAALSTTTTATATTPPATTKPAATKPPSYKKLSARDWKKIAKTPDEHIGEHLVVYGVVTQFDAATGDDGFLANADGVRHSEPYDYETNTLFSGGPNDLSDLVEDDEFRAKVTVIGSYSYDTQIGGNTTAPQLSVESIEVL